MGEDEKNDNPEDFNSLVIEGCGHILEPGTYIVQYSRWRSQYRVKVKSQKFYPLMF